MKIQKILFAAALLSLGAAACQKEEGVITRFTAGMEQSSAKTHLDGTDLEWNNGDEVVLYSDAVAESSIFTAMPHTDDSTYADLDGSIVAGTQYTAIYPAGIACSSTSVELPATQVSSDGSLNGRFPMWAQSDDESLQFYNLCGALKLHVAQASCTISRIEVTASNNAKINGTYTVSVDEDGRPVLGSCTSGTSTTTLELGQPQPVGSSGHDFYIYLPAGTYNDLRIVLYQPNGSHCSLLGSIAIQRSVCHPIAVPVRKYDYPGEVPGDFTVDGSGTKVRFAWGNLKYNYSNNGSDQAGTWTFFDAQYGYQQTTTTSDNDPYTSLLCFGYDGAVPTFEEHTEIHTGNLNLGNNGDDWGVNSIANGGNEPNQWRTLSMTEWNYLISGRPGASSKYSEVCITGTAYGTVYGLALVPDNWTRPSTCSWIPGTADDGSNVTYTAAQWEAMEASGAVFLPGGGKRSGYGLDHDASSSNYEGYYWSATQKNQSSSYALMFKKGEIKYGDNTEELGKYYGCAVRLVRVQPTIIDEVKYQQ